MAMSQPCPCCSTDCIKKKSVRVFYNEKFTRVTRAQIKAKVKTRLSWVLIMLLLGTCDLFINWVNFADLSSPELGRGLVLGPPPQFMWILLLTFTIISTVLYVPETLNTVSVFFRDSGTNFVPIIYEQLVTLPAEQIPLAAINYFISRCRQKYGSTMQTLCGTTSIVFIFVRIVWYAHMEGKLMQRKDDVKMKKGAFMAICALYACSMAFPIMNWRAQPSGDLIPEDHLEHVSLFLFKAPSLEHRVLDEKSIDGLLRSQGRNPRDPALMKSIVDIYDAYKAGRDGVLAQYHCDTNATFLPAECLSEGYLLFRFIYADYTEAGPYGEIVYNYAFFPSATTDLGSGGSSGGGGVSGEMSGSEPPTCIPSKDILQNGWKLFYLTYTYKHHDGFQHTLVSSPWKGTCNTPEPWYDTSVTVCPNQKEAAKTNGMPQPSAIPPKIFAEAAMQRASNTNRTYRHSPREQIEHLLTQQQENHLPREREPPPITDGS